MGTVVDYFKPVGAYSFCDMLQSNDKHQWSPDAHTWVTPAYYVGALYGGSAANWPRDNVPGDERKYLPKWQNVHDPHLGGCCHYTYSDVADWNRDFTMAYCLAAATTTPVASATGDPHLQNIHGERFDLMREGTAMLIHVPRGKPVEGALLVVKADGVRLGSQCADMYFQALNITGAWADEVQTGGFAFTAQGGRDMRSWTKVGPLELKVVRGHTKQGIDYLNFFVKHLGRAGFAVGGLLGEDDHTEAATPSEECGRSVSLATKWNSNNDGDSASVATASLA